MPFLTPSLRPAFLVLPMAVLLNATGAPAAEEEIQLPSNLSPTLQSKLLAQNTTPTPRVTPPGGQGGQSRFPGGPRPGGPGAAAPASSAPAQEITDPDDFNLAFPGNPIEEVLAAYEVLSGRHVIRDAGLQGNVVIVQNPNIRMTREEGVEFIKASLLLQGFAIQPYTDKIDKVITLQQGRPPLMEGSVDGATIYTREEDLPDGDQVVNFVMRLQYLDPDEASQVLANAVPTHAWGKVVAVPSANAIIVQDTVSNIRTLLRVKEKVDVEPVPQIHLFVELERAAAEDVQTLLDTILQAQTQNRAGAARTGGQRRVVTPGGAAAGVNPGQGGQPVVAGGAPGGGGTLPDGGSVIIQADTRTNRLFLKGPKANVDYVAQLAKEFDVQSNVKNLLTLPLRYIAVNEFLDIAAQSLEASGVAGPTSTTGGTAGGGGAGPTGQARTTQANRGGGFGGNQFGGGFGGGGFGGGQFGGSNSMRSRSGGLNRSGAATQQALPRSVAVGKTLLISEPRMNSLIVSGPPESINRVKDLVAEMDKRPLQVHINAVVAQVTLGDTINSGVDLLRRVEDIRIGGQNVSIAGLYSSTGGRTFLDPANLDTISGFTSSAQGLNVYATIGELFNAYVNALEATDRFKVLAKPHIAVANNEVATISIGERRPIPANTQTSLTNNGATISNIEYQDIVLGLEVQALVNSKNEITLQVYQVNDNVAGTVTISDNAIPIISTQELNTNITIPNGAILSIGGLISEQTTESVSGLPFVSKIPVVKHLFGSTTHSKQRRELVILLQPRILDTAEDMVDIHTSEVQRTVIGPEAEAFAQPERDTDDLILPGYEKDVPFDAAGHPAGQAPRKPGVFKRIGRALRGQ